MQIPTLPYHPHTKAELLSFDSSSPPLSFHYLLRVSQTVAFDQLIFSKREPQLILSEA
jgi:hypothetical protein